MNSPNDEEKRRQYVMARSKTMFYRTLENHIQMELDQYNHLNHMRYYSLWLLHGAIPGLNAPRMYMMLSRAFLLLEATMKAEAAPPLFYKSIPFDKKIFNTALAVLHEGGYIHHGCRPMSELEYVELTGSAILLDPGKRPMVEVLDYHIKKIKEHLCWI